MTIEELKNSGTIIYECISGSRAYGLETPQSDTDIKGVFVLPPEQLLSLDYVAQVSNPSNDIVYYELGRFIELLSVNNPNILELLATPEACVLKRSPLLDRIRPEVFLSQLCLNTFGRFALSQIKKARGLNKKIVNPISEKRKTVLDFCYVNLKQGSVPLRKFLEMRGWKQEDCGLVNIAHMKDIYGLYHDPEAGYSGVMRKETSNDVALSSIAKEAEQAALMYYNRDGYSHYCREYKEYWEWVEKRNDVRYEQTLDHGKHYDAKNMMHTFRLLEMAIEIARTGAVQVRRPDRDFLLRIKSGAFEYDDLLAQADAKTKEMEAAFSQTILPEKPDLQVVNQLLVELRKAYYGWQ